MFTQQLIYFGIFNSKILPGKFSYPQKELKQTNSEVKEVK
jgi:hypothetical protein